MRAAVMYEIGRPLSVEEVDLDPPKQHEVRVRVAAAGICRSDLHFMHGDAIIRTPAVLGHEGSAIVEAIGEGVTLVSPGDHVILSFVPNCGHCHSCRVGRPNLCDTHAATPGVLFDGTPRLHTKAGQPITHMAKLACFAEQAVVPESSCVPIPPDFPLEQAALIGCCVTTGVGASIFAARVEPGSTVAVIGCGGVGLNVIQGARLASASKIIAVDINDSALEFTTRFGATDAINARHQDAVKRVRELTGGRGADYTFEVFGSPETVTTAFDSARKGGTIVVVGLAPAGQPAGIDAQMLVREEKTLKGSYYRITDRRGPASTCIEWWTCTGQANSTSMG